MDISTYRKPVKSLFYSYDSNSLSTFKVVYLACSRIPFILVGENLCCSFDKLAVFYHFTCICVSVIMIIKIVILQCNHDVYNTYIM